MDVDKWSLNVPGEEISISSATLNQLAQLIGSDKNQLMTFMTAAFGAAIGALATFWSTKKSIEANVKSQQEEFQLERTVAIRSAWKGLYVEANQVKGFLDSPQTLSGSGFEIFIRFPDENVKDIRRYWSVAPETVRVRAAKFASEINIHNDLVQYAIGQDLNIQNAVRPKIIEYRQKLKSTLDGLIPEMENKIPYLNPRIEPVENT